MKFLFISLVSIIFFNQLSFADVNGIREKIELNMDLDLDYIFVTEKGWEPNESTKNVVRVELIELGQNTTLGLRARAQDVRKFDVFEASIVDENGNVKDLGFFNRGDMGELFPALRNGQAVITVVAEVLAVVFGFTYAAIPAVGYEAHLATVGSAFILGAPAANAGARVFGDNGLSNSLNPAWATGRATVERILKTVLTQSNSITEVGQELVLAGSRGLTVRGVQLSNDSDGAKDICLKVIDIIKDVGGSLSPRKGVCE